MPNQKWFEKIDLGIITQQKPRQSEGTMTKIKVKEIKDLKTKVKVNDGLTRIKEIKAGIIYNSKIPVFAQIKISDMWNKDTG